MKTNRHRIRNVRQLLYNARPIQNSLSWFVNWTADRFVNVYHESPNTDYIHKIREVAKLIEDIEREMKRA